MPEVKDETLEPDPFAGENTPLPVLPTDPEEGQDGHADLPASYHSEDGQYLVNVARPWGPVVVAVIPKGWHGAPPLQLPIDDLAGLIKVLQVANKKHKGQA
jgi:hypothetical protein